MPRLRAGPPSAPKRLRPGGRVQVAFREAEPSISLDAAECPAGMGTLAVWMCACDVTPRRGTLPCNPSAQACTSLRAQACTSVNLHTTALMRLMQRRDGLMRLCVHRSDRKELLIAAAHQQPIPLSALLDAQAPLRTSRASSRMSTSWRDMAVCATGAVTLGDALLSQEMERHPRFALPDQLVKFISWQLLRGLAHCHAQGVRCRARTTSPTHFTQHHCTACDHFSYMLLR
jgi:hypothetical protein